MLHPTKHEDLNTNILVIGADILRYLKQNGESSIEEVFQFIKERKELSIEKFNDTVLYLWLIEFINVQEINLTIAIH